MAHGLVSGYHLRSNCGQTDFIFKDTGAWFLGDLLGCQVLDGEGSYRQTVFTSRKGVPSSLVVGIETKLRAFRIQSYFRKSPLVSGPVGPDARGGVGHKLVGKHFLVV